jgi:hypothetical protein
MRAFAESYPEFVQDPLAQSPNISFMQQAAAQMEV